jgi:L-iditol 2-dehydrogenase
LARKPSVSTRPIRASNSPTVGSRLLSAAAPPAIAAAAAALAPGGTLCLYAPPAPGDPPAFDGTAVFLRELTITASYSAGPQDMRVALELIAGGLIDPLPLVTHRLALGSTGRALELQRSGEALKAVVLP